MFKLEKYKLLSVTIAASAALFMTACTEQEAKVTEVKAEATVASTSNGAAYNGLWGAKKDISGGVQYPIVGDATGPYKVNPDAHGEKFAKLNMNHGRVPTANELAAWDKDVMPDGTGLPEGSGSAEGEELYEAQCVMCHGDFGSGGGGYPALSAGNADEMKETLTNNRMNDPEADGPVRNFGSYWPQASTMFWYIRDAMPHPKSKTLTNDETYALTAYMLNINEMSIDGVEVDEDYVLDREKFLKIKMPNEDGFVPNIDGPNALEDVRTFYADAKNYGAIRLNDPSERCMKDCQETDRVARVQNGGISDFNPPMSVERSLPGDSGKPKAAFDAKKAYEEACTMCHGPAAPAAGDKAGWEPYMTKGMAKVIENGIKGTATGMPAKGGSSMSDDEFKKVVEYMLKFD